MQTIGVLDRVPAVEPLQRALELLDGIRIEQLAQLGLAEQLAELRLVDAERLRAALRQRSVPVVDEVRHVREEERRGER